MRRDTEYFSMYSLISMRTMFFSSSNRHSASALASSVLPTPVGPRNRKLPMGRFSSAMPARERRMASLTFCTASSWPMTRLCSTSGRCRSFSRSLSISLATGMPVQRAMIFAISSSVTRSRTKARLGAGLLGLCLLGLQLLLQRGRRPYFSSAARFRSYSRSARAMSAFTCSISSRSFCTLPMSAFSFSQRALMSLNCSRIADSSFCSAARRSFERLSVSFFRAASSISWLHDLAATARPARPGHGVHLGADQGAGLVHQVDGLVRQETVGDVAVGEHGRRDEGLPSWILTPWNTS